MTEPNPLTAFPPGPVAPSPDFGPSPYQSPAILPDDEQAMVWGNDPVPPMPISAAALFGVLASGVTIASAVASARIVNVYFPLLPVIMYFPDVGIASARIVNVYFPIALFLGPLVLIGVFVFAAIAFYSSNPLAIPKSTRWKVLMTLLVPPVSMLIFVPICIGSALFMVPWMVRSPSSEWILFIPVFIAYFASAAVISRRLRWRFLTHVDPHGSTT